MYTEISVAMTQWMCIRVFSNSLIKSVKDQSIIIVIPNHIGYSGAGEETPSTAGEGRPGRRQNGASQQTIFKMRRNYMGFFTTAVSSVSTLVVALGGGVGVWGVINLMKGEGVDNPASCSWTVKKQVTENKR